MIKQYSNSFDFDSNFILTISPMAPLNPFSPGGPASPLSPSSPGGPTGPGTPANPLGPGKPSLPIGPENNINNDNLYTPPTVLAAPAAV